ncbi:MULTISPECIES: GTP-binding protein [Cytobacillus]|uniref:GTP-binding protein n=1 Tax=Cytobacillus stercorigallinarum TaxID=2762240 RepID=A0ABR8QRS7_9BACI|nr:GTP-binding protein [Cytobacillus stercorigallinarum]MBD7938252.1 GTP-binding protein [Cytobacillus stercorigallinarum]
MNIENQLINKQFHDTFTMNHEHTHPVQVLGDAYLQENMKESPDLTMIRFAQGEVYFQHKDYEAAIFKWENIDNEFQPWARKNVADAYFELDLLGTAEEIYLSIDTDSDVLKIEVLLQLFSLYIQQGKLEKAVDAIKKAVFLNPDYPDVTRIARVFFEDHQDWQNAVELAVNEAMRTQEITWFHTLKGYVVEGKTKKTAPKYFIEALTILYQNDVRQFEAISVAFWQSYKGEENYFNWLEEFNQLMQKLDTQSGYHWNELSVIYHDTYFELINGDKQIKEIAKIVPPHLQNWLRISSDTYRLIASSAVLAWSDLFTKSFDAEVINDAERMIEEAMPVGHSLEENYQLFQSIMEWARRHDVLMGARFEWMVKELLDLETNHVIIAGMSGSGKTEFVQELLGDHVKAENTTATVMYKHADYKELTSISDTAIIPLDSMDDLRTGEKRSDQVLVDYKNSLPFLSQQRMAVMDTPGLSSSNKFRNDVFQYLHFADSLLFILNAEYPLTDRELDIAVKIREQSPSLPVHFILNHMDAASSEEEAMQWMDETADRVSTYFPKATIFAYSPQYDPTEQLKDFAVFLAGLNEGRHLMQERTEKMLHYIQKSIKFLLDKRIEKENALIDDMNWHEEMLTKLNGAIHQLEDMEEEKVKNISHSYRDIKKTMEDKLAAAIPDILRECSQLIREDSDFSKLHIQLNDEMNERVQQYISEKVLPEYRESIQAWIMESEQEFLTGQAFLVEMGDSFNELYGFEKLQLNCDFRILEDWKRDADRLTHGTVRLDKANIMLRHTPTQMLLKSAGKIFGLIPQNKTMLYNKYKQFVDNEDYREVASQMTDNFIQQFELFEKALDRDIQMFFQSPFAVLEETVKESHMTIANDNQELEKMRSNPEVYHDPLKLFELKWKQYEWMTKKAQTPKQYI